MRALPILARPREAGCLTTPQLAPERRFVLGAVLSYVAHLASPVGFPHDKRLSIAICSIAARPHIM
jgi:hypothetical protein